MKYLIYTAENRDLAKEIVATQTYGKFDFIAFGDSPAEIIRLIKSIQNSDYDLQNIYVDTQYYASNFEDSDILPNRIKFINQNN